MITIQNSTLILKRVKDSFILVNKAEFGSNFILSLIGCNDSTTIVEDVFIAGTTEEDFLENGIKTLKIVDDGNYTLSLNGSIVYFSSWKNHRSNLVTLIEINLCPRCKGCNDPCKTKECDTCIRNQSLLNYIQVYNNLIKPFNFDIPILTNSFLTSFNEKSINLNICFIKEELCKQLLETAIDGKSHTNQDLFNYFISIYYLGLYLYDKTFINTTVLTEIEVTEELLYLKQVYKYDTIKQCILNLGINIDTLLQPAVSSTDTNVYYWQSTDITETIDDILPLITDAYLATKSIKTFAEFEQGVAILNNNVGRMILVIKPAIAVNYRIDNYLGNDVTAEFDVEYNSLLSAAIFVTNEYQTVGSITLKLKTI